MKTFYFNVQAKGGAGKSMLTYLQALKNEDNDRVGFVDLDSSTQTSRRQLRFIAAKNEKRLYSIDLFNNHKKIEREKMFQVLEALNTTDFDAIYIDFGAPESEQLPSLLELDFSSGDFKSFEAELDAKFVFNVVVAGGTSYGSSFAYLKKLTGILNGRFEILVYVNEFSFENYPALVEELFAFAGQTGGLVNGVVKFGRIQMDRGSGILITENAREGLGMDSYHGFAARLVIKRELAKIGSHESI